MDNNFNMQQPTEQPMYQQAPAQPMYQQAPAQQMYQQAPEQQMYQQPVYQQTPAQQMYQHPVYNNMYQQPKKKKTGLIVGISIASVVLIATIVTIVLLLVLGGDEKKLIGKWVSSDGVIMTFEKDNTGTMGFGLYTVDMEWELDGDVISVTLYSEDGESESQDLTIVELSKSKMTLEAEDGEEETFTKKK